jgi:hypothetical protein
MRSIESVIQARRSRRLALATFIACLVAACATGSAFAAENSVPNLVCVSTSGAVGTDGGKNVALLDVTVGSSPGPAMACALCRTPDANEPAHYYFLVWGTNSCGVAADAKVVYTGSARYVPPSVTEQSPTP